MIERSSNHLAPGEKTLGFIGFGAFGRFAAGHLAPHFKTVFHDPKVDDLPAHLNFWSERASLQEVACSDVVVLTMPVQKLSSVVRDIAPLVKPGALILDVCSVKSIPVDILSSLPRDIDIVGTHPLFGPQSGKNGIAGLPIALVPCRGNRIRAVRRFLERRFGTHVHATTAEHHDRQMARVQGLTHLIAKVMQAMPHQDIWLKTATYDHLESVVDKLRYYSDELFAAIYGENPYVDEVMGAFFQAVDEVSYRLGVRVTDNAAFMHEGTREPQLASIG